MLIRAEYDGTVWVIRTLDANGATWFRRLYKTAPGALKAVQRLQAKHTIQERELQRLKDAVKGNTTNE